MDLQQRRRAKFRPSHSPKCPGLKIILKVPPSASEPTPEYHLCVVPGTKSELSVNQIAAAEEKMHNS